MDPISCHQDRHYGLRILALQSMMGSVKQHHAISSIGSVQRVETSLMLGVQAVQAEREEEARRLAQEALKRREDEAAARR